MAKAVGFGGVFLKARDPKALAAWYTEHLGIQVGEGGAPAFTGPESAGTTLFCHFPSDSDYFGDAAQQAMINFRVDNLDQLLVQLEAAGVRIDPHRDSFDFGKFAWIWDLEGNKVELWEVLPDA